MGRIKEWFQNTARAALGLNPGGTWIGVGGMDGPLNGGGRIIDERSKLSVATYFACIRNIASDTAKLPFRLLENVIVDGRVTKKTFTGVNDYDTRLSYLLNVQPNPWMTAYTFRRLMIAWAAGWGTGYALIDWTKRGDVFALWPIHPSRVMPRMNDKTEVVTYEIHNNDGTITRVAEKDMFKIIGMSPDGRHGYSVLQLQTNTLNLAQTAQMYARHYLGNSARPAGVLETDMTLKPEARENLKKNWAEQYAGALNAGKTPVLESAVKYKGISVPMKDMQFLELRQFQKEEICSWFRMPLYKVQYIGNAQGWSTLDGQESDYVNSCLMDWIVNPEQEYRRQLMNRDLYPETVEAHFEVKGLMRGAMKDRIAYYQGRFNMASITPNEIRAMEDENPEDDPNADKLFIQSAMIPLSMAGEVAMQKNTPQNGNSLGSAALLRNGTH